jgi:hypothetical protein
MKERALKKLDKALHEACLNMRKPKRSIMFILNDFAKVKARCGSAPYEGCEEIAAQTMAVISLLYLTIAEEHLIVEYFENDFSPKTEKLSGDSWPGLADKATELAQMAIECHTHGATSSVLRNLLDEVIQRAQKIKGEGAGSKARVVRKKSTGGGFVYVPSGWDAPASFATTLSDSRPDDVRRYIRSFSDGEWLITTMGLGG